jgi:hypothetical protein
MLIFHTSPNVTKDFRHTVVQKRQTAPTLKISLDYFHASSVLNSSGKMGCRQTLYTYKFGLTRDNFAKAFIARNAIGIASLLL